MSVDVLIAITVFFGMLGLVLAISSLGSRHAVLVQSRLARHQIGVSAVAPARRARVQVLDRPSSGRLAFLRRWSIVAGAKRDLDRADLHLSPIRYFVVRIGLALVLGTAVWSVVGNPLAAAGGAAVGYLIPRFVVKQKGARRARAFEAQLAETIDLVVGSLRVGQGLMQAIEVTSQEQSEPMRTELRRIVDQVNLGMSVTDAMETLTSRFNSRDVELLVAAIAINRESGGNLSEVLANLAGTVRQRYDIREEAKSLTAAPRATSYMLAALPFAIAAYTIAMSPIHREQLLFAPLGRVMLIGAVIWSLVGFSISSKLAKVEY